MTTIFSAIADCAEPVLPEPWWHDPVAFVDTCVDFPAGKVLLPYQRDVLAELRETSKVAVRGPHGAGKSGTASFALHWWAAANEALGIDWKVLTTAGGHSQLNYFLWPEIRKWATRLRWGKLGRVAPYDPRTEMMRTMLRLGLGQAVAVASDDPSLIEGAHASAVLVIVDEAKSVVSPVWDSIEGALSVGKAAVLALSTPGPTSGRFWEIHTRRKGLEDWSTRHITRDEVIAAGQMSEKWAAQRAEQWGEDSALYANRVLGEFHADDDSLIPLAWAEAAIARWHTWKAPEADGGGGALAPSAPTVVSCDVARFGSDRTVIVERVGDVVYKPSYYARSDTMATAGHVAARMTHPGHRAIVDVVGLGAGVVDRLREQGFVVAPFHAQNRTDVTDRSGEVRFVDARSAAWYLMRERLDPAYEPTTCLPPDDELLGDLVAPRLLTRSDGRIEVESKDEVRRRIGRSPDAGDAVVMAFWGAASAGKPAYASYQREADAPPEINGRTIEALPKPRWWDEPEDSFERQFLARMGL